MKLFATVDAFSKSRLPFDTTVRSFVFNAPLTITLLFDIFKCSILVSLVKLNSGVLLLKLYVNTPAKSKLAFVLTGDIVILPFAAKLTA